MVVPRSQRSLAVSLALREQGHPIPPRGPLSSRRALADEVAELIVRELIVSDVITPGELLPSENELTERYVVSRVTVRAALRTLKEAGLISVRQGVGAIVLPRPGTASYALERLGSLDALARGAGRELVVDDVEIELAGADAETARRLRLDADEMVLVARRTARIDGTPVAWLVDHVRRDALAPERLVELDGSGLDALLADTRVPVDYADCEIAAVGLPAAVAARLEVKRGTVALLLDEVVHAVGGHPLARCQGWHLERSESPRFSVRRRRVGG